MKTPKKDCFVVGLDVFQIDVSVMVNMTEREIEKKFRNETNPNKAQLRDCIAGWDKHRHQGRFCSLHFAFLMLLRTTGDFKQDMNTISHEATHVVYAVMRHNSIPMCEQTEEVFAFLSGFLIEKIANEIVRHGRNRAA